MTYSPTSNAQINSITPHNSLVEITKQNTYHDEAVAAKTALKGKSEPAYFSAYCSAGSACSINVQVDFKAISRQRRISDLNKTIK